VTGPGQVGLSPFAGRAVGAVVVLLEQEINGPTAAATFAAAQTVAGDDVRTVVLAATEPGGDLPALGELTVGVLPETAAADPDSWFDAVSWLVGESAPVVLFAAGSLADAVAGRLAGALGYSPVLDVEKVACTEAGDGLVLERLAFGGKATHRLRAAPRGLVLALSGAGDAAAPPLVVPVAVHEVVPEAGPLTDVAYVATPPAGLVDAEVVVAGGRGVGEPGFREVEELAARLGAAVGASRAAVDAGWARPDQQVGLTGQTVAPSVYLAIGISGASQHLAGMSRSDVVLAVNSDEAAPMMGASDVAFIADWHALWPVLERLLPSRKGEAALPSPR